jgi:hypothetical protein
MCVYRVKLGARLDVRGLGHCARLGMVVPPIYDYDILWWWFIVRITRFSLSHLSFSSHKRCDTQALILVHHIHISHRLYSC